VSIKSGQLHDAETGWYYFRARYYDPQQRRFVQEDPAGHAGGTNLYAYVEGRVFDATDPSGLAMKAVDPNFGGAGLTDARRGGTASYLNFGSSYGSAFLGQSEAEYDFWALTGGSTEDGQRVFGPTRPLTPEERAALGTMCSSGVDCGAARIGTHPIAGNATTLGNVMYMPSDEWGIRDAAGNVDRSRLVLLAHEMTHVAQYQSLGDLYYYVQTGFEQLVYARGYGIDVYDWKDSYSWNPGRPFGGYGREQQASIVGDCYAGNATACTISPYHPPVYYGPRR
jgi:RHS repeat-associated protein